ncbi:BRCT domain-containing protein, partial [Empedobacter sp. UBA5039]
EEDAAVCGKVFLKLIEQNPNIEKFYKYYPEREKKYFRQTSFKNDDNNNEYILNNRLSNDEINSIQIDDSYFLFTGELKEQRENAQKYIEKNGGKIAKSVIKKLDYVVLGDDYGWSKINKIIELNNNGSDIKILLEDDFNYLKTIPVKSKFDFKFTEKIVDCYDEYFKKTKTISTLYGKYIYYSQNISPLMNNVYQIGGNINATVVNHWKDESLLTDYFVISDKDYKNIGNNIYSKEVLFIEDLIKKQQTLIDTKKEIISSKIMVIKYHTFKKYAENRNIELPHNYHEEDFYNHIFKLTDANT